MHPYGEPLWQRFLVTDKGVVLVVLAVGNGQPAQLQVLSLPLSVRYCKSWARTSRDWQISVDKYQCQCPWIPPAHCVSDSNELP